MSFTKINLSLLNYYTIDFKDNLLSEERFQSKFVYKSFLPILLR